MNKGNLAFEFDQVHIICPVYEPGAFDNETEKYIIYNVSKVEYETCRITNADPRVIAICDKPQKLMFFTITFRPFTPQPGGLEFLPGNDYYFICELMSNYVFYIPIHKTIYYFLVATSSKDDLYRRIGGRCSTNNMKVVFKVCCALEEKNRTTPESTLVGSVSGERDNSGSTGNRMENSGVDIDINRNVNANINAHGHGHNSVNTIGISGVNTGFIPAGSGGASSGNKAGQLMPVNGMGTSINTNIDQFNRIPLQPNIVGNNIGAAGSGIGNGNSPGSSGGIILSPGHGSINMLPPGRGSVGIHMPYPGHHHIQTGIRINNVPTQQNNNQHPHYKGNGNANNNNNNGKDILKNQSEDSQYYLHEVGKDNGNAILTNIGRYLPPVVDTNHSNIVQSTINWLLPAWGSDSDSGADISTSSSKTNITLNSLNNSTTRLNNNYTPTTSHSPPDHGNEIKKSK